MQGFMDFFKNDRGTDGELILDELNVDLSKHLKCIVHV